MNNYFENVFCQFTSGITLYSPRITWKNRNWLKRQQCWFLLKHARKNIRMLVCCSHNKLCIPIQEERESYSGRKRVQLTMQKWPYWPSHTTAVWTIFTASSIFEKLWKNWTPVIPVFILTTEFLNYALQLFKTFGRIKIEFQKQISRQNYIVQMCSSSSLL